MYLLARFDPKLLFRAGARTRTLTHAAVWKEATQAAMFQAGGRAGIDPGHQASQMSFQATSARLGMAMPSPASYSEARTASASAQSPRLPPLAVSPRNVRSVGAAFDSREVQVRRLQQLNLTPRLGGAGRVGMLPGGRIGDSWTDRPVLARRSKFTQGFVKPIPPRKKTEEEMTDSELAVKARRDRVAVLVEQRREQLSLVKANAAAEERRLTLTLTLILTLTLTLTLPSLSFADLDKVLARKR